MEEEYIKEECKACGYIYKEGMGKDNEWQVLQGDRPFINLKADISIEKSFLDEPGETVKLIACPKCGTVKVLDIEKYNE